MTTNQRFSLSDFPSALHDELTERIARYSVGLTRIEVRDGVEKAIKSGSGTLVAFQGHRYLLTADHVVEDIKKSPLVGLLVDWTGRSRRCVLDLDHLQFVRVPRGNTAQAGPDLAAIRLPDNGDAVAILLSLKNFYDLDRRMEQFKDGFHEVDLGLWLPCGVLAEGSQDLEPERGFGIVRGYYGLCGLAAGPSETHVDGFDYLELTSDPSESKDVPTSFKGLSGGGLWHAIVGSKDGALVVMDCILSGVIFYEDFLPDGVQVLRSHGRNSVYRRLAEQMARQ
jgi:hypothetical protein